MFPARLWLLLLALCGAIALASGFAIYAGVQEVRLHRAGPRRELMAEEIRQETSGWLLALGCARHDLEVAVDPDGIIVSGERGAKDRIYFPLVPQSECEDEVRPEALHVAALVESRDAASQGLSRLYGEGYKPPPTRVVIDGVI